MNYLDIAIKSARIAGSIHKKYFAGDFLVKSKATSYDLLTVADTEAEEAVVSLIKRHFPQHNILAEEYSYAKTDSEYTWVIDPLDGTNNFACGLPIFCASVALIRKNEVIVGAIYDVMRNELFYCQKYFGSFLNGKPIRVNKAGNLKQALLITGFYYSRGKEMVQTLETIKQFHYEHIIGIRRLGAAALDLCYVACGRAAGYWEFQLSPWDFCAGKLLIEESGGTVTDNRGGQFSLTQKSFIVASNGKIHPKMIEVINRKELRR
jgi:myo-inositol-1(or 4)-monophosphatase